MLSLACYGSSVATCPSPPPGWVLHIHGDPLQSEVGSLVHNTRSPKNSSCCSTLKEIGEE